MADNDELREAFQEYLQKALAAVQQTYLQMAGEYCLDILNKRWAKGGDLYEEFKNKMIGTAEYWYGTYTPTVYVRTGSLTNEANIVVEVEDLRLEGTDIMGAVHVENASEHAGYANEGFYFYKKGRLYHRIGTDLTGAVSSKHVDIEIPSDVADQLFDAAVAAVYS